MSDADRDRLRALALEAARLSGLVAEAAAASLFNKVAALEACRINPFQPAQVWHPTVFGDFLELDLREHVSREIYLTGAFEPDLLWFFTCVVDAGMHVIDGGAHIGYFSIALGRLVGVEGRVDAFEPIPSTKHHLDTNVRNAKLAQVKTHGLALWSKPSSLELHDWGVEFSAYNGIGAPRVAAETRLPEAKLINVGAISIDAFVDSSGRSPGLVKLDVESAEDQVLQGMENLMEAKRPIIVMEVGDFVQAAGAEYEVAPTHLTLRRLLDAGYTLFEIRNCHLHAHEIYTDRPYSYGNLVALPKESIQSLLARTGSLP